MDWFRGQRERPAWYLELTLLVGGYLAFGLARAGVDRGDPMATSNSALVQRLERSFHIAAEYPLNRNHPRGSPAAASSTTWRCTTSSGESVNALPGRE